jgi:hypothetical protein
VQVDDVGAVQDANSFSRTHSWTSSSAARPLALAM